MKINRVWFNLECSYLLEGAVANKMHCTNQDFNTGLLKHEPKCPPHDDYMLH